MATVSLAADPRDVEFVSAQPSLPVRDVTRSAAFYKAVVGLELAHIAADGSHALLRSGGAELALSQHDHPTSQRASLEVRGVDVIHARCIDNRVTIDRAPHLDAQGTYDFVFTDPDGHGISVGERKGR